MSGRRPAIGICFAACVIAVGCGGTDDTPSATVERDSAGVVIVENRGPWEQWRVANEPVLRIGVVAGDSAYQFHRVMFAGRLSDGRVVVADGGAAQIRWFSETGQHHSTVGGEGPGPGEFGRIGDVRLTPGDTLVVHDTRNRRLTRLSPGETLIDETPVTGVPSGRLTVLGVLAGERLAVAVSTPTFDLSRPDVSYTRDTLSVLVQQAGRLDTIIRMPGRQAGLWVRYSGGQPTATMQMAMPFAHETFAVGSGERVVLAVGERHELRILDATGVLERIARRADGAATPVEDAMRQRYVDHLVDAARRRGQPDPGTAADNANQLLGILPEGQTMPSFDEILVDSEGRIWMRDAVPIWTGAAERMWTVHRSDGHVEATVIVPADLDLMHAGRRHVTGVVRDSLDVEYVVVHALERAP